MKTINLYLKSSDTKKCIYYVYRDTDPSKLPADVLTLTKLKPIATIDEASYTDLKVLLYTDELEIDKTNIPTETMLPFAFTTVPMFDDIHDLKINISKLNDSNDTVNVSLTVSFDNKGMAAKLIYTDEKDVSSTYINHEDIIKYIEIHSNYIHINRDTINNYVSIQAVYYVGMIKVVDTFDDSNSTSPTGLNKPIIDTVISTKSIAVATVINYLGITPAEPDTGINYYYRILTYDPTYGYSLPSKLMAANLTQLANDITFDIQSCSDYNSVAKTGTFINLVTGIKNGSSIQIGNPTSADFSTYGNPFITTIPVFKSTDINVIDASIDNGIIVLNIPNVWQNGDTTFNTRNYKAFRIIASLPNGKTSAPSDTYYNTDKVNIPIEKMILLKKDITGLSDTTPIQPTYEDGILLCTWIRKNGIYYDSSKHGVYPYNVQDITQDIQIMSENSIFSTLNIVDKDVLKGKSYMYTIYLYDCFKQISNPICLIKSY